MYGVTGGKQQTTVGWRTWYIEKSKGRINEINIYHRNYALQLVIAGLNLGIKENIKHKYKIVNRVQYNSPVYTPETNSKERMRDRFGCELCSYEQLNATTYGNPPLFIDLWNVDFQPKIIFICTHICFLLN